MDKGTRHLTPFTDWFPALARHICLTVRELHRACASQAAVAQATESPRGTGFVCDSLHEGQWVTVAWDTIKGRRVWAVLVTSYSTAPFPQESAPAMFCSQHANLAADLARALELGIRLPVSVVRVEWHPSRPECYAWTPFADVGFVCTRTGKQPATYVTWKVLLQLEGLH